jgi:tRNA(fMet)-specific endonuclease VapC
VTKLLDTSTCVAILRGRPEVVVQTFLDQEPESLVLSSVVVAELLVGSLRSTDPARDTARVEEFVSRFVVLEFGLLEADCYARIRHALERGGNKIGANDLLIAATAVARGLVLVTHNTAEFSRVTDLTIEDWHTVR